MSLRSQKLNSNDKQFKNGNEFITPEPDYPLTDVLKNQAYVNPNFKGSTENSIADYDSNGIDYLKVTNTNTDTTIKKEEDFLSAIACFIINTIKRFKKVLLILLFVAYNVYLYFAIHLTWKKTPSHCNGVKLLVIITSIAYIIALYYILVKRFLLKLLYRWVIKPVINSVKLPIPKRHISKLVWLVLVGCAIAFVVWDAYDEPMRIASGGGLIGFILLGFIFSKHRSHVIWSQVLWGVALQFVFGLAILRWSVGKEIFSCFGDKVSLFLTYTDNGTVFIFDYLVSGQLQGSLAEDSVFRNVTLPPQSPIFAFKVLPVIIFFSFFVSILYFYGVMQIVVQKVGWLLQVTIGTTACESLNASGNIFLGMTEAPLMIKPFLPIMTKSELHAVMTGGFATIAGSVMAAYINFGVSASHLLSASVMSAPAALSFSKLMYPETEVSKTSAKDINIGKSPERNAVEAGANGACIAVKLVANIAANLIAFLAMIAFLDAVIQWFGSLVDYPELNFKWILAKIFVPISLMMGVTWDECDKVSTLIGLKTLINEFVAYQELGVMIKAGALSSRAQAISTYALCGFSNFGSIGIQLGSLGGMAPTRKADLATIALRAMVCGSAACFMTACVAGMLIRFDSLDGCCGGINNNTTDAPLNFTTNANLTLY